MVDLETRVAAVAPGRRVPVSRIVVVGMLLAGWLGVLLSRWWTGTEYTPAPFGLPDPGLLTSVTMPLAPFMHGTAMFNSMNCFVSGGTLVILPSASLDPVEAASVLVSRHVTRLIVAGDEEPGTAVLPDRSA